MSDRNVESPFYIFGQKILIIAPTEKYDYAEYGFEIHPIIYTSEILSRN